MATMNISLPDSLKSFAQQRATSDFSNPSDYIRALIRADKMRFQEEQLERALLEGLASGSPQTIDDEFWSRLKQKAAGSQELN